MLSREQTVKILFILVYHTFIFIFVDLDNVKASFLSTTALNKHSPVDWLFRLRPQETFSIQNFEWPPFPVSEINIFYKTLITIRIRKITHQKCLIDDKLCL